MNKITKLIFILTIMNTCNLKAQMPDIKEIKIDNIKIAYYEQEVGQSIILLHGWPQTSYVWRKNICELSKTNRVIAVDLPGFGKSEKTDKYDTHNV